MEPPLSPHGTCTGKLTSQHAAGVAAVTGKETYNPSGERVGHTPNVGGAAASRPGRPLPAPSWHTGAITPSHPLGHCPGALNNRKSSRKLRHFNQWFSLFFRLKAPLQMQTEGVPAFSYTKTTRILPLP